MFEVSVELKNFILVNCEICISSDMYDPMFAVVKTKLVNTLQLKVVQELVNWFQFCYDNFIPSDYKANVGPFSGVFPTEINFDEEGEAIFSVDQTDNDWFNSWKSWFLRVEDM